LYGIDAARVVTGSKCGSATEKGRRPSEDSVRRTVNKSMFDERRARSGAFGFKILLMEKLNSLKRCVRTTVINSQN